MHIGFRGWIAILCVIVAGVWLFFRLDKLPRLSKWFGSGVTEITLKSNVFWIVAFILALILTTVVPYLRFGSTSDFDNYVAFASPAAAGIVVGAAIFFDPNPKFDLAGKAYLASVFLIFLGWLGCVFSDPLGMTVLLWAVVLTIASASAGLIWTSHKRDFTGHNFEALFIPLVWHIGATSVVLGLIAFFLDKELSHA